MTNQLTDKAMLIKLSISQWSARKHDKGATAAAEAAYNTTDAGRFNKVLIAKEALQTVSRAANDARTYHYANTLPWTDEGKRILPAANFYKYSAEMRKLKASFEAAVAELVANYDALVAEAKLRLNGMFNPADYPSDIKARFKFETQEEPIPAASDFRVCLNDEETARIKADIERRVNDAAELAHQDIYKRLYEALSHVVERLNTKGAIFRDSLIENLVELCHIIPALNIKGDTELEAIRQRVEQQLTGIEPQVIRDNENIRQNTAKEAQDILDAMSGLYS